MDLIQLSVQVVLNIIIVMVLLLCFFTFYIMFQRQREMRMNNRRDRYIKNYSQMWYDYLLNDEIFSITLIPRGKPEVNAIEIIFLSYINNLTNGVIIQKIKDFSNLYLLEHYIEDLSHSRWSIRMNALYRIFNFQMDQAMIACNTLEKKKISKEEYFQLLKINSLFQPSVFMEKIESAKFDYSESEYRRLFVLLKEDVFIRFFNDFDQWPARIQFAVIDTAAVKRSMIYIKRLEQLLQHDIEEVRIRALKGLNEIGVIENLSIYVPFVASDIWEERLMIAKIFKYIPLSYTYSYLEQLLQDDNWWVRSEAAKTIAKDANGVGKFQNFIESSKDTYAVEIPKGIVMRKQEIL